MNILNVRLKDKYIVSFLVLCVYMYAGTGTDHEKIERTTRIDTATTAPTAQAATTAAAINKNSNPGSSETCDTRFQRQKEENSKF